MSHGLTTQEWVTVAVGGSAALLTAAITLYVNRPRRKRLLDELQILQLVDYPLPILQKLVDRDVRRYVFRRNLSSATFGVLGIIVFVGGALAGAAELGHRLAPRPGGSEGVVDALVLGIAGFIALPVIALLVFAGWETVRRLIDRYRPED